MREMDCHVAVKAFLQFFLTRVKQKLMVTFLYHDSPALFRQFQIHMTLTTMMITTVANDSSTIMETPTVKTPGLSSINAVKRISIGVARNSGSLNTFGTPFTYAPPTRNAPQRRGQDWGACERVWKWHFCWSQYLWEGQNWAGPSCTLYLLWGCSSSPSPHPGHTCGSAHENKGFNEEPWVLNVSRVSTPLPGTLLAQLARLVRITKAAQPAATLCVVGVRAWLQNFLIWEKRKGFWGWRLRSGSFGKAEYATGEPGLPERHCVQRKHCLNPLVCSIYVPSSHSWHTPRCPDVLHGEVTYVPNAQTSTDQTVAGHTEDGFTPWESPAGQFRQQIPPFLYSCWSLQSTSRRVLSPIKLKLDWGGASVGVNNQIRRDKTWNTTESVICFPEHSDQTMMDVKRWK